LMRGAFGCSGGGREGDYNELGNERMGRGRNWETTADWESTTNWEMNEWGGEGIGEVGDWVPPGDWADMEVWRGLLV